MAGVWALLAVPTVLWSSESVLWVAFLSLYANFLGRPLIARAEDDGAVLVVTTAAWWWLEPWGTAARLLPLGDDRAELCRWRDGVELHPAAGPRRRRSTPPGLPGPVGLAGRCGRGPTPIDQFRPG